MHWNDHHKYEPQLKYTNKAPCYTKHTLVIDNQCTKISKYNS